MGKLGNRPEQQTSALLAVYIAADFTSGKLSAHGLKLLASSSSITAALFSAHLHLSHRF